MLSLLNLPAVPKAVELDLIKWANDQIEEQGYWNKTEFEQSSFPNVVDRRVLQIDRWKDLDDLMGPHIPWPVSYGILIMENTGQSGATFPPHSDLKRGVGFNYILETGGDHVETCFFDKVEPRKMHWSDAELTQIASCNVAPHKWYLFDSSMIHCVRKVETKRIILMMFPYGEWHHLNFADMHREYPQLFSHNGFPYEKDFSF